MVDVDAAPAKPFTWSYSRLKAWEICPRRYHETQVLKNWPEDESPQLKWGNDVHAAMAKALQTGEQLPAMYQVFQPWIDKIARTPGELMVEEDCKWAITRELRPCAWMAKNVWLRAIADALKVDNDAALVIDWKAGKSANVDPVQNQLVSLIVLIYFPKVQVVRSDFIWLQEDDHTTQVLYRNEAPDQWADIMHRVQAMEQATAENNFPPKPNPFCRRWCPVKTCEFWGR